MRSNIYDFEILLNGNIKLAKFKCDILNTDYNWLDIPDIMKSFDTKTFKNQMQNRTLFLHDVGDLHVSESLLSIASVFAVCSNIECKDNGFVAEFEIIDNYIGKTITQLITEYGCRFRVCPDFTYDSDEKSLIMHRFHLMGMPWCKTDSVCFTGGTL